MLNNCICYKFVIFLEDFLEGYKLQSSIFVSSIKPETKIGNREGKKGQIVWSNEDLVKLALKCFIIFLTIDLFVWATLFILGKN